MTSPLPTSARAPRTARRRPSRRPGRAMAASVLLVAALATAALATACTRTTPGPPPQATPIEKTTEPAARWMVGTSAQAAAAQVAAPPESPRFDDAEPGAALQTPEENAASAFARWFMELYPYVDNTGDTQPMDAHSTRGCGFCRSVVDGAQHRAALGIAGASGAVTVTHTRAAERWWDTRGRYQATLTMTQQRSEDRGFDGAATGRRGPTRFHVSMILVNVGGVWGVDGLSATPVQALPRGEEPRADELPTDVVPPGDDGTQAGIAASVRYSLLRAHAEATGDLGPLQGAESPDCFNCDETHALVTDMPERRRPRDAVVRFETASCWTGDPLPWVECHVWLSRTTPDHATTYSHDITEVTWDGTRWAVTRTFEQDELGRPSGLWASAPPPPARSLPVAE